MRSIRLLLVGLLLVSTTLFIACGGGSSNGSNTNSTYMVTYNANNAISGSVPTDPNNYGQGQTVTVFDNTGNLVRTGGYNFAGWNTQADGSGTTYSTGQTFAMGTANVTLYAKWVLWAFVDGNGANGINQDVTGGVRQLTAFNSKLYATWSERPAGVYQIRVAVYNGKTVRLHGASSTETAQTASTRTSPARHQILSSRPLI